MSETTTQTVELEVRGDGTALGQCLGVDVSLESGYQSATADKGTVRAVCPDPAADEEDAIVYVTGVPGPEPGVPVTPGTTVSVTLTYAGE